jgi:Putative Ig domain
MKPRPTIAGQISLLLFTLTLLSGCGGGSSVSIPPPSTVVTPTSVAVTCQSPVQSGTTDQCSAVVAPTGASHNVTWTASSGTISASGALTAPTVTAKTDMTVTATAGSLSGAATVEVDPAAAATPAPTGLTYPGNPVQATVGVPLSLTPVVNGTVTSYSVTPALPSGLTLNTTTGVISGTATTPTGQAAYVVKASNASGSTTFSLSITVSAPVAGGAIAISASNITFDNQLVSTSSSKQPLAIINTGSNSMTISGVHLAGGNPSSFTVDASGCTSVPAGGTCIVKVGFSPSGLGPLNAQMNISTSATAAPTQVFLNGNGVAASMTFDNPMIPVGQTATLTWNAPNATSCTASGTWSGAQPTSGTLAVTPSAAGYDSYTLTCPNPLDPMGNDSQSVVLTAVGPSPQVPESNPVVFQAYYELDPSNNQYLGYSTSITVPPLPTVPTTSGAALFLWPGLDPLPSGVMYNPIGNGVLQPVLTFGPSCAPTTQPTPFSAWWISGQYVNTLGSDTGFMGCFSGNSLQVNPGDVLLENISLGVNSTVWTETITDVNTVQSVTFSEDLKGQAQGVAYWVIEAWFGATISGPVTFYNSTLTPQVGSGSCNNSLSATNAYAYSPPTSENANSQCFIRYAVIAQH